MIALADRPGARSRRDAVWLTVLALLTPLAPLGEEPTTHGSAAETVWRSPVEVAFSPDGKWLAIADATAEELVLASVETASLVRRTKLQGRPSGAQWSADGTLVYVAEADRGTVSEVDAASGSVRRVMAAGRRLSRLAVAGARELLVADEGSDQLVLLNLASGAPEARIAAARSPWGVSVSGDRRLAVVGNRLPAGAASDPGSSAEVTLIALAERRRVAGVALPANSTNVRGVACPPAARWAYVVHTLARATLPTTQIEYGWISANALSVIDVARARLHATVLLDLAERGCANPWGVAVSPDGGTLWVSCSGTHELARVDLVRLHAEIAKVEPPPAAMQAARREGPISDYVASERSPLVDDPASVELVVSPRPSAYGMGVYLPGIIRRFELPGLGPRGLALTPDGRMLAVAMYFSGSVLLFDTLTNQALHSIVLSPPPPPDPARRGEIAFHDARLSHQQWLSCATCHPDGRVDGLNWDLMNDGVGNPKNTRSLVLSHRTAPVMSRGVRESFEAAVAAGFEHILFREGSPQVRQDVEAYLRGLQPEPSPFLINGELSEAARRGKALFEDARIGCGSCHVGPLLTDLKVHEVGTRAADDQDDEDRFLTPKLLELWRTAPYLHHGQAVTLREVLTKHNREDRRGRTTMLDEKDLEALEAYLRSL